MRTVKSALAALVLACLLHAPARAAFERRPAPDFRVRDFSGRVVTLKGLTRGGPLLLDFWATWCKPCLSSMPELAELHARYGPRGLHVLGISVDGPRNISKVPVFAAKLGIPYRVVVDEDGSLQQKFHVAAVPTTVLVDSTGTIVNVKQGYRPGEGAVLEANIRALLGLEGDAPDSSETK